MSHEPTLSDFMGGKAEGEAAMARAGAPLEAGEEKASEEAIVAALRTVHDPEIPVNIYDLGLIYKLDRAENGDVAARALVRRIETARSLDFLLEQIQNLRKWLAVQPG